MPLQFELEVRPVRVINTHFVVILLGSSKVEATLIKVLLYEVNNHTFFDENQITLQDFTVSLLYDEPLVGVREHDTFHVVTDLDLQVARGRVLVVNHSDVLAAVQLHMQLPLDSPLVRLDEVFVVV